MRALIASDSYKGSISSLEAGRCIRRGLTRVFPEAVCDILPIADGGEGTVEALYAALGGRRIVRRVRGPRGRRIEAGFALLADGTAVIEMAAASGLALLQPAKRDPRVTDTYGTGELIRAALDADCKAIFIGIGGSATNDGGTGMARALGARFLDEAGRELPGGGLALSRLETIDISGLDPRLARVPVTVACDVTNPLCGPEGASRVYGPQKGADPAAVEQLEAAMVNYGEKLRLLTGRDLGQIPGSGAAGGLGAGLMAFCGGELKGGFHEVCRLLALEERVRACDVIFSGEGRVDATSAKGKVLSGLGELALRYHKPLIALCGSLGEGAEAIYPLGVTAVVPIAQGPGSLRAAFAHTPELITAAAERTARLLSISL